MSFQTDRGSEGRTKSDWDNQIKHFKTIGEQGFDGNMPSLATIYSGRLSKDI